jgi:hypothetical protein
MRRIDEELEETATKKQGMETWVFCDRLRRIILN